MFSVGVLYSAQLFLEFVNTTPIKASDFPKIFNKFHVASPKYVLHTCLNCRWLTTNLDDYLILTSRGQEIIKSDTEIIRLRIQIKHLIDTLRPAWGSLLLYGRAESQKFFPSEVKQCFKEANLLDIYDDDVINWWDELAAIARGKQYDDKVEIGRIGEKLSFDYEKQRTGKEPFWQAIESNFSGYDILSILENGSNSPLMIEVKTCCSKSSEINFHISQNEWQVAEYSQAYVFHLWVLSTNPNLYIVQTNQMAKHIPVNKGKGIWELVQISLSLSELPEKAVTIENMVSNW